MNTEILMAAMRNITDENLNMIQWADSPVPDISCGTTMCLAGHVVVAAGRMLKWQKSDPRLDGGTLGYIASETTTGESIEWLATQLLEVDEDTAEALFFYIDAETVDELWVEITEITGVRRPADAWT